jgi:hypothetical protein
MKSKKQKCHCNEELNIQCSVCFREENIYRIAEEVATTLLGSDGMRLVIEREGKPFGEAVNKISGGGNCRSSVVRSVAAILSRRTP